MENYCILIQSSLNFVPDGIIDNKSSLLQVIHNVHCNGMTPNRQQASTLTSDDKIQSCHMASLGDNELNTLKLGKVGRHFPDDIFKCILLNENVFILIKISLKFIPKGPINNIPALVQIMAWSRPGDKPLSEPMVVGFLTHICVTRPQWVKYTWP